MVVVVVLGMHRSGTSCLTRMLQQAGLFLGSDLMDVLACSNLEGHAEAHEAVRINNRILELSGGAWDRVPATLCGDEDTASRIRAFLQTFDGQPVAGWKDPRTTLTWPLWKPHLPRYRLVACVRHPLAVARSLQVRDGCPLDRGLALWSAYNERLLQHLASEDGVCWVDFDRPEAELTGRVQTLCRQLGLSSLEGVTETFNPYLRHHVCSEPVNDRRVQGVYERLLEQVRSQAPGLPKPAEAGAAGEDRLAKLAKVQQLQNELQQQQTRWLDEIRKVQVQFQDQLNYQQTSCQSGFADQQNALQEVQRQQTHLHQELQQQGHHFQQEFNRQWVELHQALGDQHRQGHEAIARLETVINRLADNLAAQMTAAQARHQELEAVLAECHDFMERIRGSLPFRCRRALHWCLQALSSRFRWRSASRAPSPAAGVSITRRAA